ncbi:MAG: transglutaminase domain-containing protein [Syntrophomonadaceae bacterium]|nr:transglutaminase domain-containing protein [Syntrophomonadaceae bacterium]
MKRLLLLLICLITLSIVLSSPIQAAEDKIIHQSEAEKLNVMGLLLGNSNGYELDKYPSRIQGAIMLVRLLGKEKEAVTSDFSHPFSDISDWADPYAGYLYTHKLSYGSSPNTFTPDAPLSAEQYMTFVLRALDYDDQAGDFTWQESIDKAKKIGLFQSASASEIKSLEDFRRDDMVWVSYLALQANQKGQETNLLQKLVETDHAISLEAATQTGTYPYVLPTRKILPKTSSSAYVVTNQSDYEKALTSAMLALKPLVTLSFSSYSGKPFEDFETIFTRANLWAAQYTGISELVDSCSYQGNSESMTIKLKYVLTAEEINELDNRVADIINKTIKPGMTQFEKELALHDYIIDHCAYDYKNYQNNTVSSASFNQYGVLVLGKAVCQGYADAMFRLCREAGLECHVVSGEAKQDNSWISHAWNIVKIDGQFYQLDVTWDDPIMADGTQTLSYYYFNLTDAELTGNHRWERTDNSTCTATDNNYYVCKNLLLNDIDELEMRIREDIDKRSQSFEFKLNDFTGVDEAALNTIMQEMQTVKSFYYNINEKQRIIKLSTIIYQI